MNKSRFSLVNQRREVIKWGIGGILLKWPWALGCLFIGLSQLASGQCENVPVVEAVRNGDFELGYLPGTPMGASGVAAGPSHDFTSGGPFDFFSDLDFAGEYQGSVSTCWYNLANMYGVARIEDPRCTNGTKSIPLADYGTADGNYTDHTTGTEDGYAFFFDFNQGDVSWKTVWGQNVEVFPSQTYYFSAWFGAWSNTDLTTAPTLRFRVEFLDVGNNIINPALADQEVGSAPATKAWGWEQFNGTIASPANAVRANIYIECDPTGLSGQDDLIIDDISFINGCQNIASDIAYSIEFPRDSANLCWEGGSYDVEIYDDAGNPLVADANKTIVWYEGTGGMQAELIAFRGQTSINVTDGNNYRACVYDPTNNGCAVNATIEVVEALDIPIGEIELCSPVSVDLDAGLDIPNGAIQSISWSGNSGTSSTRNYTVDAGGSHSISVTAVSGYDCDYSETFNVDSKLPTAPTDLTYCDGGGETTALTLGDGNQYKWCTDANCTSVIGTGTSVDWSVPSSTTGDQVVYMQSAESTTAGTTGPTTSGLAAYEVKSGFYYEISVEQTILFSSVQVQVINWADVGDVTITVLNADGSPTGLSHTEPITPPAAGTAIFTIDLGLVIPEGDYRLQVETDVQIGWSAYQSVPVIDSYDIPGVLNTTGYSDPNSNGNIGNWVIELTEACDPIPVTVAAEACCTAPAENPTLNSSASDLEVCDGENAEVVTNAITSGLDFIWQIDRGDGNGFVDVGTVADAPGGAITLTGISEAGDYRVKIAEDGNIAKTCVKTSPAETVVIQDVPDISTTDPPAVCDGEEVDITSSTVWSDGNSTSGTVTYYRGTNNSGTLLLADAPQAITDAGDYYIQVDNNGCVDGEVVTVSVTTVPDLTGTAPAAVCDDQTVDITDPSVWSDGNATGGTVTYYLTALGGSGPADPSAIDEGGFYIVEVDNNSCTDTLGIQVTIHPRPVADLSISANSICDDGSANLLVDITTGTGDFDIRYNGDNGSGDQDVSGATEPIEIAVNTEETFTLVNVVDNATGCASDVASGNLTGSEALSFYAEPAATVTPSCDETTSSTTDYSISVEVTSGDLATTTVQGNNGVNFQRVGSTNVWETTANVEEDVIVDVSVEDGNACETLVVTGSQLSCSCPESIDLAVAASATDSVCEEGSPTVTTLELTFDDGGNAVTDWAFTLELEDGTPVEDYTVTRYVGSSALQVANITPGSYYVRNVEGTCPGSGAGPVVIGQYESPDASISGGTAICDEGEGEATISINFNAGEAPFNFIYNGSTTGDVSDNHPDNTTFTFPSSDDETWSIVSVQDANGCTAKASDLTETTEVTFFTEPSATTPVATCDDANNDASLDIFNYTISLDVTPGSGTPSVIGNSGAIDFSQVGTTWTSDLIDEDVIVEVLVFDDNQCDTLTFDVSQTCSCPTSAVLSLDDADICADEQATLSLSTTGGSGPYNITIMGPNAEAFSQDNVSEPFPTLPVADSGSYRITRFFDVGEDCDANVTNVDLIVYPLPTATLVAPANSSICDGDATDPYTIELTGTPNFTIGYSFNGSQSTTSSTNETTIAGFSAAGTLELTSVSDANCTGTVDGTSYPIAVQPRPTITVDRVGDDLCDGGTAPTIELTFSGTGPYTFEYIDGVNTTSFTETDEDGPSYVIPTANSQGAYSYTLVSLNDANCAANTLPAPETYDVYELPSVTSQLGSNDTICDDGTSQGTIQLTFTGGQGPYDYTYQEPGSADDLRQAFGSATVTSAAEGVHNFVNITDSRGCVALVGTSQELWLKAPEDPSIVEGDTSFCESNTGGFTLNATNTNGYPVTWWISGTGIEKLELSDALTLVDATDAGAYDITVEDGICSVELTRSDAVTVTIDPIIENIETSGDANVFVGSSRTISASVIPNDATLTWSGVDYLTNTTSGIAIVTPVDDSQEGGYALTVLAERGTCSDFSTIDLVVRVPVLVPNTFTPNNDDVNDSWQIQGISAYDNAIVRIYNRWGGLVYENIGVYDEPWDGRRNGKELPPATYYYVIDLGTEDINGQFHKGDVTIIK